MQPSELPVVEVPTLSTASGTCHRSPSIRTQRASMSAVCGYSSLSTMFLSNGGRVELVGLLVHPGGDERGQVEAGVAVEHHLVEDDLVRRLRQHRLVRDAVPGHLDHSGAGEAGQHGHVLGVSDSSTHPSGTVLPVRAGERRCPPRAAVPPRTACAEGASLPSGQRSRRHPAGMSPWPDPSRSSRRGDLARVRTAGISPWRRREKPPGEESPSRARWMATCLRRRVAVLPDRAVSRLSLAGRAGRRRGHLLRWVAAVHGGWGPPGLAGRARSRGRRNRPSRVVDGDDPVRGHDLLQHHDFPGLADSAVGPRVRPAGLAAGRVRFDLLPDLRADRLPSVGETRTAAGAGAAGWWQPGVNLLGCLFFGVAAVSGYVVPTTGTMLDLAAANWTTAAGAACFLACAVAGLAGGHRSERSAARILVRHDRAGSDPHDRPGPRGRQLLGRDPLALLVGMLLDQHMRQRSSCTLAEATPELCPPRCSVGAATSTSLRPAWHIGVRRRVSSRC